MTRYQTAQVLAGASAATFFADAALHASGYRAVVLQAQQGIGGMTPTVSALWLAFAAALVVLGAMVGLVALGRVREGRWILALAGCFPLITVLLQLLLLGFTRSTALLAAVAVVTLAAAVAFPSQREVLGASPA